MIHLQIITLQELDHLLVRHVEILGAHCYEEIGVEVVLHDVVVRGVVLCTRPAVLLEYVEVQQGSSLDNGLVCLGAVEMDQVVHLEEIIKVHFLAGARASIDVIELLRKLHGGVGWQESPPEHAVGQGVVTFELGIDLGEVMHIILGDRQAHFLG